MHEGVSVAVEMVAWLADTYNIPGRREKLQNYQLSELTESVGGCLPSLQPALNMKNITMDNNATANYNWILPGLAAKT